MNSETFLDGRVTLYRGDCLSVLNSMEADSVDCVAADPPYENHMHNSKAQARGLRLDGYRSPEAVDFDSIEPIRDEAARQIVRVCKGAALIFCTPEGIAPWRDALEAAGARYKRACFWIKPDSAPQFNGQGPAMAVECFVFVWCGKGFSKWNGGGRRNYWTYGTNAPFRDGRHPTEKPVDLMTELLTLFSNVGDLVLDPFMGSGTTGVAATLTNRGFIGIEAKDNWYQVARERVGGIRPGSMDLGPLFEATS